MSGRKPTKILPSVEFLRECLVYDHATGVLRWKKRPCEHFVNQKAWATWNAKYVGRTVGTVVHRKYVIVRILGLSYLLHRVVWKLVTGDEPPTSVDHRDGNPANNRWRNLRGADQSEQNWNSKTSRRNTSGYRGVSWHEGKWLVRFVIRGELRRFGRFDTLEEAAAVYEAAARKAHGSFYRTTVH